MNKLKKLVTLCICCAMAACFIVTPLAKASSSEIPDSTLDFYYEGISLYDEPYMGGEYSSFQFEALGNGTLTFKFDAECSVPKTTRYAIGLRDGRTGQTVESRYINATNNQYVTFYNLTPYKSYYLKFSGNSDIKGKLYVSKTGVFN